METNLKSPKPIRLTNQQFSLIRHIFFELSAAYSLVKLETLINKEFSIINYMQQLDSLRMIYVKKDIPAAKIKIKELNEIIFNLQCNLKTINSIQYLQSKELKDILLASVTQLERIIFESELI